MFTLKPLSLTLCCCVSWFYLLSPALAQVNSTDNPNYQQSEYNSLTGPAGLNPLDLIHRANFGTSRTSDQFQSDSQQNLDNAATDFKRQQQELWENQQQTTPE
mgnify:CR=1 FL=1